MSKNLYEKEIFQDVEFPDTNTVEYIDCTFNKCTFENSNINNCFFTNCKFNNCNLSNSRFVGTRLSDCEFTNCRLIGFDWGVLLKLMPLEVKLTKCNLDYSIFFDIKFIESSFLNCSFKEASFESVSLRGCLFSEGNFELAVFNKVDLRKADLSTSVNYAIDTSLNKCKGMKVSYPALLGLLSYVEVEIV
jgi:fluoroquinolone resistance protein